MSTKPENTSDDESKLAEAPISDDSADEDIEVFPELNQPNTAHEEVLYFEIWSNAYEDQNKKCEEIINNKAKGQMTWERAKEAKRQLCKAYRHARDQEEVVVGILAGVKVKLSKDERTLKDDDAEENNDDKLPQDIRAKIEQEVKSGQDFVGTTEGVQQAFQDKITNFQHNKARLTMKMEEMKITDPGRTHRSYMAQKKRKEMTWN